MSPLPPVRAWTLRLDNLAGETVAGWRALLDCTEQARADRFVFARHRFEYIAAHALLRGVLSIIVPEAHSAAWRFVAEKNGKPVAFLNERPAPLSFSLSHTEGLVGVVAAPQAGCALGFDLEALDRPVTLDVAERYFRAEEISWLASLPEARRAEGFLRLWTLKEAFIKATGEGLSGDLASFWFTPFPPNVHFRSPRDQSSPCEKPGHWHFDQRVIGARFIGAIGFYAPERTSLASAWTEVTLDQATGLMANIVSCPL